MTLQEFEEYWEENNAAATALFGSFPVRTGLKLAEEALEKEKFFLASTLYGYVTMRVTAIWMHTNEKSLEQHRPQED